MSKRGKTAGSARTYFKKGNTSSTGRPKNPPELIMINKLTKDRATVLLNKFLEWPLSELQAYLKDSSNPVLEYYIAKLIYQGIVDGNVVPLSFLFDRLLGKVVDKVEITRPVPTIIELLNGEKKIILGTQDKTEDVDLKTIQKKENENGK